MDEGCRGVRALPSSDCGGAGVLGLKGLGIQGCTFSGISGCAVSPCQNHPCGSLIGHNDGPQSHGQSYPIFWGGVRFDYVPIPCHLQ